MSTVPPPPRDLPADTSSDKTNKPLGLANCSGERKPRKIKDPAVTPFRAAQFGSAPRHGRAPTGPRTRRSERLADNRALWTLVAARRELGRHWPGVRWGLLLDSQIRNDECGG
ncbi:hypothetical protein P7K49_036335 [Saguinus oedipus]|uniref:Uncharacterized protein n=1 Tax=Saguinus oedipus TaxID=9490 RepID=A0ABQ9TKD9_SAGOE|nr:hypothetical protein P7K49_036335 [Saguinus oedipus]